ncbi:RHS repeat-associated core domain-containing protein, partial [Streptomyces achromogenes]|uniref:RHS repeat-associated core domain-containing protein n=2 Tax=Streptomyces TaxID=1883 RepID=UPI0005684E9A
TDLVGTPTELLDEQGDIAWHTRSTLWGTTAWSTNSTTYTPLRFPGQYYDPETGLHYNYFRHYDPETAR